MLPGSTQRWWVSLPLCCKDVGHKTISAYRYICKSDENVIHSAAHQNLAEVNSPKTSTSIQGNRAAGVKRKSSKAQSSGQQATKAKRKRLTNTEMANFIRYLLVCLTP